MRPRSNAEGVHPARTFVMSSAEAEAAWRPGHSHASRRLAGTLHLRARPFRGRTAAGPPFSKDQSACAYHQMVYRGIPCLALSPADSGLRR